MRRRRIHRDRKLIEEADLAKDEKEHRIPRFDEPDIGEPRNITIFVMRLVELKLDFHERRFNRTSADPKEDAIVRGAEINSKFVCPPMREHSSLSFQSFACEAARFPDLRSRPPNRPPNPLNVTLS